MSDKKESTTTAVFVGLFVLFVFFFFAFWLGRSTGYTKGLNETQVIKAPITELIDDCERQNGKLTVYWSDVFDTYVTKCNVPEQEIW